MIINQDGIKTDFRYVVLKRNKIIQKDTMTSSTKSKVLVQIVDMSDKILYNETKAEQSFLTIIKAAFSHELRNPLNSLTGQVTSFQSLFGSFRNIIQIVQDNVSKDVAAKLYKIYDGLNKSGNKMFNAANHIDHYVHDILDYTILSDNQKQLSKEITIFEVQQAIEETIEIQQDKIKMKNIDV